MCYNIGTGRKSVMLGSALVAPRADLRMVLVTAGGAKSPARLLVLSGI